MERPFHPGYSTRPVLVAGRDDVRIEVEDTLARVAEDRVGAPGLVLIGQRGMGKTVMLAEMAETAAERYGWPRLRLDAGATERLAPQALQRGRELFAELEGGVDRRWHASRARLGASVPGLRADLTFEREAADQPEPALAIDSAISAVVRAADARGGGIVVTVDELHDLNPGEVKALAAVFQRAADEAWPLGVAVAGLTTTRGIGKLATYFERATWLELSRLDSQATRAALAEPAKLAGRVFDPDALELVVEASGGYPYAIQVYGDQAWRASHDQATINLAAAQQALVNGRIRLEQGLYAQRWQQASGREREYLYAVAREQAESGTAIGASVAKRLGQTSRGVAVYRARLLGKGTLQADGTRLDFTVPGMREYVLERGLQLPTTRTVSSP